MESANDTPPQNDWREVKTFEGVADKAGSYPLAQVRAGGAGLSTADSQSSSPLSSAEIETIRNGTARVREALAATLAARDQQRAQQHGTTVEVWQKAAQERRGR